MYLRTRKGNGDVAYQSRKASEGRRGTPKHAHNVEDELFGESASMKARRERELGNNNNNGD